MKLPDPENIVILIILAPLIAVMYVGAYFLILKMIGELVK